MTPTGDTEIFPCGSLRETRHLMAQARACKCGSVRLFPVSDFEMSPIIAIACDDCGEREGESLDLPQAMSNCNWNRLRTQGNRLS